MYHPCIADADIYEREKRFSAKTLIITVHKALSLAAATTADVILQFDHPEK
jgi:hypothetical protein